MSTDDLLTRITWSLIAEPSDAVAVTARQRLGLAEALDLVRHAGLDEAVDAVGEVPRDPAQDGGTIDPRRRMEKALLRWRARLRGADPVRHLEQSGALGIRPLVPGDAGWPPGIEDLEEHAPPCLWVAGEGDVSLAGLRGGVAVVGARASTAYGEDIAGSMAASLAARDVAVVSGGAYGIDAAAHRGALAAQGAPTLAVLAGGLDTLYPRGNTGLLGTIRDRFALLSEAPLGTAPTRWRFLSRNRLIAALTQATVVVEAGWRSGALSTARWADEISRQVAAVPGPVTSAASAGCHRLIRERGAVLVADAGEVLELLPGAAPAGESPFAVQDALDLLAPADRRVLDAVPPRSATTLGAIAQATGRHVDEVLAAVGRLELFGEVRRDGERVRRERR